VSVTPLSVLGAALSGDAWSASVVRWCIDGATIGILAAMALCLWRLVKGPTSVDRGIAADTFSLQVVGLTILFALGERSPIGFDVVLIVALLGFVSTAAFAQYVGRKGSVD